MMDVSTPFRLVLSLEEHFPMTSVRREVSAGPLPLVGLLSFPLPLPWHRPSIAGPRVFNKTITRTVRHIADHLSARP
jgi:hypothetical protein